MRTVYVQRNPADNNFNSENCFVAAAGFGMMGYRVVGFRSVDELPVDKDSIVVGGIMSVRSSFDKLGIPQPKIDNPHKCLPGYLGRVVQELTFSEVEEYTNSIGQFPFFVKPLSDHKLFTGYVVKSAHDLIQAKMRCQPDTKLIISECIDFISEYRCFVLNAQLIGSKNYTGDFRVSPDYSVVESAIRDYKNQPAAYSIDFGITSDSRTLLIEMNDAFGLSSYGLNKIAYCKMLEARWDELTKKYSI